MSNTENRIRVGLIGAGGIFQQAHKSAFKSLKENVELVAVCDANIEAAKSVGGEFKCPAYHDSEVMLNEHSDGLSGLMITTPHHLHFESAKRALQLGIPALIEKPVVCSMDEIRALSDLEKQSSAFVQSGQQQRFGDEENWLKQWFASEDFGIPRLFNLDIYQNVESYMGHIEDPWILDGARAGGGIAISVAIHILDLIRYWFDDDFETVFAQGNFDAPLKNGAEATIAATLTTRSGIVGTLNCSYLAKRCPYSQRTLLFGSRGSLCQHIEKPGAAYAGQYYVSSDKGKPSVGWDRMYEGWQPVSDLRDSTRDQSAFVHQLSDFVKNIVAGKSGENSLARNANTIATVEAITRSIVSHKPETVEAL